MTALYIVLGILALIVIAGLLRLGAHFEYSQNGLLLIVKVGFIKIQVFPETKEKKRKKKKPSPEKEKRTPKPKRGIGETVKRVKAVIPTAVQLSLIHISMCIRDRVYPSRRKLRPYLTTT